MAERKAIQHDAPSPLVLLRHLREIMAGGDGTQSKLDRLVRKIAEQMHSEVCSIYLIRPGQVLELVTSAGLNPSAIHYTRLLIGQGLVGDIAATGKTLNLAEAASHPKFVYRPETGEEIYHSFVGVPIRASDEVIGVLVVQSIAARTYSEEEVEVLETIAMVLAELAVGQQLVDRQALLREKSETPLTHTFHAHRIAPGVARAPAVLHRPYVAVTRLVTENTALEEKRLHDALDATRSQIDQLISEAELGDAGAYSDILETYRMFLYDQGWMRRITERIKSGFTAEASVKKVYEDLHARLSKVANPHIRQRIEDIEDISSRVLAHLSGTAVTAMEGALPNDFILVARTLGPGELLEYGHRRVKGVILEEGSAASHIAIIAKMLDVPVIGGVWNATEIIRAGDDVVVDGDHGEVSINPPDDMMLGVNMQIEKRQKRVELREAMKHLPTETKDGVSIAMHLNIGLTLDAPLLTAKDIDGIGLYRTELPYLTATRFPGVDEQAKIYYGVIKHAYGKPVIFRTFDIGGDKQVPYFHLPAEQNPALGWRATRIGLDRPKLLKDQFQALLSAAAGETLHVMFPMIATVKEFQNAKSLLIQEQERFALNKFPLPKSIKVGAMLEIPSLLFDLDVLLKEVDFLSIGSNDLLQYLFAADRCNEEVADRYDTLDSIVIRVLSQVAERCKNANVPLGFCGDMATRPLEAMALLAAGIRSLSVPPPVIGPLKAMIRSLDLAHLKHTLDYRMQMRSGSMRSFLHAYASDHGVTII
ncbi:MAG: phosphoenolpyruvate--protein phosphotransferase [Rickettsiales bacterium]